VKLAAVRAYAMALPEVTEEPHHNFGSFRVRGKVFVTMPPDQEHIHVFVPERERDQALAMYPLFTEKLLWGSKVAGIRVSLPQAVPSAVKSLVLQAWRSKAPRSLQGGASVQPESRRPGGLRRRALPNPSLERRPSTAGRLARASAKVHHRSPGQGARPLRAPQLER